jgi:virulence factor Mce-like protein
MSRGRSGALVANPVLVGAVTTLVVIVAVFLAYNANTGLPFVPTRQLKVQLANGSQLVKGNEVREGGYRIGVVSAIEATRLPDGTIGAQLQLKLDKKAGPVPVDSTVIVRPRSALGLKYVELTKGSSTQPIPDGGTLPISHTSGEVELDQLYNMFDRRTREAAQVNLREFGNAFAGRGPDLSLTIQELAPFFRVLEPVAANLANPATQLDNFFRQLDITVQTVAPVSAINARLFTTMADTFAAIVRDPQALRDTISKNPPTLDVGTRSFAVQIPFLRDTAAFSVDLSRAARSLRAALPDVNGALKAGIPVTRRSVALYGELQDTMGALRDLAQAPTTNAAIRGLTATVTTLQPQLRFLGPFVTTCNYWNTFWTFTADVVAAPTPEGTAFHAMLNSGDRQNNRYEDTGAVAPANGEGVQQNSGAPEYFHGAPYGHSIDSAGNADCAFGQTGYLYRAIKYGGPLDSNPPKGPNRFKIVTQSDVNLGYRHGPTFKTYDAHGLGQGLNPDHVPPGETFTNAAGGIAPPLP